LIPVEPIDIIAILTANNDEDSSTYHHYLLRLFLIQPYLLFNFNLGLPLEKTDLKIVSLLRNNREQLARFKTAKFQYRSQGGEEARDCEYLLK
jgi:hypothetical protein